MRQKVIIVQAALERLREELFEEASVEANVVPTGENALALGRAIRVDLVVLPDRMHRLSLKRFLEAWRSEASESRAARVAVLAGAKCPKAVRSTRDPDLVLLDAEKSSADLERDVAELLRKKPRACARVMVNIGVTLEGADRFRKMCQAVNISESGLLIRSSRLLERGTEVAFEIYLPEESRPVRGEAMVVRSTDSAAEGFRGMGLRFLRFEHASDETLRRFLEQMIQREETALAG